MFQITRRADYAVRILLALAAEPAGTLTQARALAASTDVPPAFLYRITAALVQAGLVRSCPGPTGGLALARPAAEINVLQILEAMDGPLCLNVCLVRPHECPRDRQCPAHGLWGRLQTGLAQQLRQATLAGLLAEGQLLQRATARTAEPAGELIPLSAR